MGSAGGGTRMPSGGRTNKMSSSEKVELYGLKINEKNYLATRSPGR